MLIAILPCASKEKRIRITHKPERWFAGFSGFEIRLQQRSTRFHSCGINIHGHMLLQASALQSVLQNQSCIQQVANPTNIFISVYEYGYPFSIHRNSQIIRRTSPRRSHPTFGKCRVHAERVVCVQRVVIRLKFASPVGAL